MLFANLSDGEPNFPPFRFSFLLGRPNERDPCAFAREKGTRKMNNIDLSTGLGITFTSATDTSGRTCNFLLEPRKANNYSRLFFVQVFCVCVFSFHEGAEGALPKLSLPS